MKKVIAMLFFMLFVVGCVQQSYLPVEPAESEGPIETEESSQDKDEDCTEKWICRGENVRSYRTSDCTFQNNIECPAGCENGVCNEETAEEAIVEGAVVEKPVEEVIVEETQVKETKKDCELGWMCLDENRKGYQSSSCIVNSVDYCEYGCEAGKCILTPPPEEIVEETFSLIDGKSTMGSAGVRYCDFSKEQILLEEVSSWDLKITLYSKSNGYDYFRIEGQVDNLWIIDKEITGATREDCVEKIKDATSYSYLTSKKSLCVETKEYNIAILGGTWDGTALEDTELSWKYYS
ncbi:MAG: hypothetical protein U9O94_04200 [Nanoarchaeota archaeon]|nr:hypothetical protein [Nanoarchaeota archaeon]